MAWVLPLQLQRGETDGQDCACGHICSWLSSHTGSSSLRDFPVAEEDKADNGDAVISLVP